MPILNILTRSCETNRGTLENSVQRQWKGKLSWDIIRGSGPSSNNSILLQAKFFQQSLLLASFRLALCGGIMTS